MNFFHNRGMLLLFSKITGTFLLCLCSVLSVAQHISHTDSSICVCERIFSTRLCQKTAEYYTSRKKQRLFLIPFVSWNEYDKWHFGFGAFTNPVRNTGASFRIFPGWSLSANSLNYAGHFAIKIPASNNKLTIEPFVTGKSYNYDFYSGSLLSFSRYKFGIATEFLHKGKLGKIHDFMVGMHQSDTEILRWNIADSIYEKKHSKNWLLELSVNFSLLPKNNANLQNITFEVNNDVGKVMLTMLHRFHYKTPEKYVSIRLFAGTFLYRNLPQEKNYRLHLSGVTGNHDYNFAYPFLSRSEYSDRFIYNQLYPGNGFFKTSVPTGQSWDWLLALNIKADFPGHLPLQFYLDLGTYNDAGNLYAGNATFPWNFGVAVPILKEFAEIYIPLFMSEEIKNYYSINQIHFFNRITWMIRFDLLNPFNTLKQCSKQEL